MNMIETSLTTRSSPVDAKRTKATYYLRKEEIQQLEAQVVNLQEQISQLKQLDSGVFRAPVSVVDAVNKSNLILAGTQSLLSNFQQNIVSSQAIPLHQPIHLGLLDQDRVQALETHRVDRLAAATRFMRERNRFTDLSQPQHQRELVQHPNGDMAMTSYYVHVFDGGHSLRQVFQEFTFFMMHQEMTITEQLGILTIRDSGGSFERLPCAQARFISTVSSGMSIESNTIKTARCIDDDPQQPPYAIAFADCVDRDDLYPYRRHEYARHDTTGAIMLEPVPTPTGGVNIVMTAWSHGRLRMPLDSQPKQLDLEDLEGLMEWCKLIPLFIRERLAMRTPSP